MGGPGARGNLVPGRFARTRRFVRTRRFARTRSFARAGGRGGRRPTWQRCVRIAARQVKRGMAGTAGACGLGGACGPRGWDGYGRIAWRLAGRARA
jgi:hypothetical protein